MSKFDVVFVLGRPGAGKGTQCSKLAKELGYHHLNVGGLLRAEMEKPENENYETINKYMKEGKIVPVEITCSLLENEMHRLASKYPGKNTVFLIDGFPRDTSNRLGWDSILGDKMNLKIVVYLDSSENTCKERIMARSKTSGRYDDNLETIKKRFPVYERDTMPVIEHYKSRGKVLTVNAERDADDVYGDIKAFFIEK